MSARGYFMKRVKDCKDVSIMSPQGPMKTDKFTLFAYCNFLDLLSTTVCSQNINKQNVNISDETYRFQLSQKVSLYYLIIIIKNYLKRLYRIRH